jgi:hypothetical protein
LVTLGTKTTLWLRLLCAVALILIAGFIVKNGRTYLLEWLGISVAPSVTAIGGLILVALSIKSVRQALKQLDAGERENIPESLADSAADALIAISRGSSYADSQRDYRVLLDGQEIGRLADGDTKSFPIIPGAHSLKLKIDWAGSNEISFDANTSQTVRFECMSCLRGWRIGFAVFALLTPNSYIKLVRL